MQIPKILLEPAPDKAFALSHPIHVFDKLVWEFHNLKTAIADETQAELFLTHGPSYHAFNFAVTAWHLVDWVWASANEQSKDYLREFFACDAMTRKAHLFDAVANKYRCIHICGQIANGSKHKDLRPSSDDPDVRVSVVWEEMPGRVGELRCNDPIVTYKRHLVIRDGGTDISALEVFRTTVRTWDDLMGTWGFREDRLYGPDMDPMPWD